MTHSRPIHFESMRQTLEAAAKIGVEELYSACLKVKGMIEDNGFRLPVLESYESLSHLPTDEISKKLLPAEWKHVTPFSAWVMEIVYIGMKVIFQNCF